MSNNDAYFQLPLSCLAYGGPDHKQRLHAIIDWCIMDRANDISTKETKAALILKIEDVKRDSLPAEFSRNRLDHLAIVAARMMLRITGGNISGTMATAESVSSFIATFERVNGRSPTVRIRNDLLWDCVHGSMTYRDFSVLCAIYSVIGAKEYPVIITRDRIIAGQLGYKSPSIMTPEALTSRTDGAKPLTVKQVRKTLDELEHRSLITRIQASKRKVYFSNRMSRDEMRQAVITIKVKRATKVKKHRIDDGAMRVEIDAAIKVALSDSGGPRKDHTGANGGPREGHERGHFNKNPLIESSLKETEIKETRVITRKRDGISFSSTSIPVAEEMV